MSEADDRALRLAEALRANLRRRKEQARQTRSGAADSVTAAEPPPDRPA